MGKLIYHTDKQTGREWEGAYVYWIMCYMPWFIDLIWNCSHMCKERIYFFLKVLTLNYWSSAILKNVFIQATVELFLIWTKTHVMFQRFFHRNIATLGSILDSQLSWESGKFQLARWSHRVALWSSLDHPPPTAKLFLTMLCGVHVRASWACSSSFTHLI